MVDEKLRELLSEVCEDAVLFDNPSFDKSVVGLTTDGQIVCSLRSMVQELCEDDNIQEDEAREFVDYNTIRMLPYISAETRPVIIDDEIVSMYLDQRDS